MLRERVAPDIYVFTSDLYVQVTASAIISSEGIVLIDTMPFPVEAREIRAFLRRSSPRSVSYIIYTHYHADHTYGAYLFPAARVIAHQRCRDMLIERGDEGLRAARAEAGELEEVRLCFPELAFEGDEMLLHLGDRRLRLIWTPGHSRDMISVFLEEEQILFAGDTVMAIPVIVDGEPEMLKRSLRKLLSLPIESIVQGHGEVILRGEVREVLENSIVYLEAIQERVAQAVAQNWPLGRLLDDDLERYGFSRVALNGRAPDLHLANLATLYREAQRGG